MARRILVTAALPYANGSIHIGHLVEYIQTDIWVRFQKMRGHDCVYCCADDTHGTPVMIRAKQRGISPEELIAEMHEEHQRDFDGFDVDFDSYYITHSDENRQCSETIYNRLKDGGHITTSDVEQAYCESCGMFLPDRFIRGTCPKCGGDDQYGDSCELCHATYRPVELTNAVCSVCGREPTRRKSKHYFVKLSDFTDRLKEWVDGGHVHNQVKNKLQEWFEQGLRDWDFSRDGPYFGFQIPGEPDKYFYVWFDAPVGYIASTMNYCKHTGRSFQEFWCDDQAEIHHFIGKDITYFHALYWPVMLMGAGFNTPTKLAIHGFLTVNGEKMSKSRGTFINAATYLHHLDPQYLRYYYACKLSPGTEDIDLNTDDFVSRINSDLVGNFANLASRSMQMLNKRLEGRMGGISAEAGELLDQLVGEADAIADDYEERRYGAAVRRISALADNVNRYMDKRKPWAVVKDDADHARETLTCVLNASRILAIYLKPILPRFVGQIEKILAIEPLQWSNITSTMENKVIGAFERLVERMDPKKVEAMIEESKEQQQEHKEQIGDSAASSDSNSDTNTSTDTSELASEPIADEISFDEFMKVDLRVARVAGAELVEGANKLLRLQLDLGGEVRTVLAGIRKAYEPQKLIGRHVIMAANLAPRKMKFGVSEGMILAAGPGGSDVFMLAVDDGAKPGQRVH